MDASIINVEHNKEQDFFGFNFNSAAFSGLSKLFFCFKVIYPKVIPEVRP